MLRARASSGRCLPAAPLGTPARVSARKSVRDEKRGTLWTWGSWRVPGSGAGEGPGVLWPRPLLDQPRTPQAPPTPPARPARAPQLPPHRRPPGLARPARPHPEWQGQLPPVTNVLGPRSHTRPFSGSPGSASRGLPPTGSSRVRPGPSLTPAPSHGVCWPTPRSRYSCPHLTAGAPSSQPLA